MVIQDTSIGSQNKEASNQSVKSDKSRLWDFSMIILRIKEKSVASIALNYCYLMLSMY